MAVQITTVHGVEGAGSFAEETGDRLPQPPILRSPQIRNPKSEIPHVGFHPRGTRLYSGPCPGRAFAALSNLS